MLKKIFFSEARNILKNRWIIGYLIFLTLITTFFIKISGDFHKSILSLSNLSTTLIPLVVSFFTGLYWYYNDRYLELLLTQPVDRKVILIARLFALSIVLGCSSILGPLIPFMLYLHFSSEVLILLSSNLIITVIFVSSTIFINLLFSDRMKGMGLIIGLWLYLVLIHDGLLLFFLIAFKDYPLDILSGWLGILNPLGLARVLMMLALDGALLLGQISAIIRNLLSSWWIYGVSAFVVCSWIFLPVAGSIRLMRRKDF